jgi:5-(carboxyamino)imidazole ribonucleotide synthase
LEAFVPFDGEVSIVGARGKDGATSFYPLVANEHRDGILRVSRPLADVADLQGRAEAHAHALMDELGYVGVLAIEFFRTGEELLGNEFAPRVHNTGHWTIEGAETSQFEQHLRAVTGLPLGSSASAGCSAMANLIGGIPDPAAVAAIAGAHLHNYGKAPRPNRKLGHITVQAADPETLAARWLQVTALLDE